MNKIKETITESNIEIPKEAIKCAITLYVDSASAGQTTASWDLSQDNCLSFANNQIQGCAYIKDGVIVIENVIAYVVFFS
jgi:hypothetical protein